MPWLADHQDWCKDQTTYFAYYDLSRKIDAAGKFLDDAQYAVDMAELHSVRCASCDSEADWEEEEPCPTP